MRAVRCAGSRLSRVAAVALALVTGWGGGGARAEPSPSRDLAPARFTLEIVEHEGAAYEWTQADGYRDAVTSSTATVEGSDPRIGGTLTMTLAGREFGTDGDPGGVFGVVMGTARIDGADGDWVGRVEGFWTEVDSSLRILLAGEGAYDGLTALIRGSDADTAEGVIFGHGLPPRPGPIEPGPIEPWPPVRLDLANDRAVIPLEAIPEGADHILVSRRTVAPGAQGVLEAQRLHERVALEYAFEGSIRVTSAGRTRVWRTDGTIEDLGPGTPHELRAGDVELAFEGDAAVTYLNEGAAAYVSLEVLVGARPGPGLQARPPRGPGSRLQLQAELPDEWLVAPLSFRFERLTLAPGARFVDQPTDGLRTYWWVVDGDIDLDTGTGSYPGFLTGTTGGDEVSTLENHHSEPVAVIRVVASNPADGDDRPLPDALPPAHFTMELEQVDTGEVEWAEAGGYRQGVLTDVGTITAGDPRVSGALSMTLTVRLFGTDEDSDTAIIVGRARIDNIEGAWVGTLDGVTGAFEDVHLLLAGEGAYEGLTALIRDSSDQPGFEGVLFGHGLPSPPGEGLAMPSGGPAPPGQVPTTPAVDGRLLPRPSGGPTPPPGARPSWVRLPDRPAPPRALRAGRSLGDPRAPVEVVVYQDPQCPHCARFTEDIEPLLIAGPIADGEVILTYRDFAVLGRESLDAAVAMRVAEALGGRFWDYQRVLFHNQRGVNQGAFSLERLADLAEAVGLDREAFLREMDDPAYMEAVEDEVAEAKELGIEAVPSLVINGAITVGVPTWEGLEAAIEAARSSGSRE